MKRFLLAVLLVGCGSVAPGELDPLEDAGSEALDGAVSDAGLPQDQDSGAPGFDAGEPSQDAGEPVVDAGNPMPVDSGVYDAGQPMPPVDAGVPDAGPPACTPGTLGCGCAYNSSNMQWSCGAGQGVCDLQAGKCTNCGYNGGPCCNGPSGRTCNAGSSACLRHTSSVYQCHANFACSATGTGTVTKACFEGGCCNNLTCNGTCG